MNSCGLPGKYNNRVAAKRYDELIVAAVALGICVLIAACLGFAGSLLLIALVAAFLGVVQAILRCSTINLLHVVLLGYIVFAVFAAVPIGAVLAVGGAGYITLTAVSLLLEQFHYERYAIR